MVCTHCRCGGAFCCPSANPPKSAQLENWALPSTEAAYWGSVQSPRIRRSLVLACGKTYTAPKAQLQTPAVLPQPVLPTQACIMPSCESWWSAQGRGVWTGVWGKAPILPIFWVVPVLRIVLPLFHNLEGTESPWQETWGSVIKLVTQVLAKSSYGCLGKHWANIQVILKTLISQAHDL